MNRKIFTNGFLIAGLLASGTMSWNGLALGISKGTTDPSGHGPMVPPSFSLTFNQREVQYQAGSRRDPFVPLNRARMQRSSKPQQPNSQKEKSDDLKVLGIVYGQEGYRAVLQLANGKRVLVKPGSVLEYERARVIRISDDAVLLEYRRDENGSVRLIERRISIHHSAQSVWSSPG